MQEVASAVRIVNSTALRLSTGSTPGMPVHTGQVFPLGEAPNAVEQAQKILLRVESWAWTSSPMTVSNAIASYPSSGATRRTGRTRSIAPAAANSVSSWKDFERSCAPMGSPSAEKPHGTEIPGMPARLHGIV